VVCAQDDRLSIDKTSPSPTPEKQSIDQAREAQAKEAAATSTSTTAAPIDEDLPDWMKEAEEEDAKMLEREEKAKKMALEEAAAEAGVARSITPEKYRNEKAEAEAVAEEKRRKTAEHEAKQLARADVKLQKEGGNATAVSPQTDAKWREREEKARQKAAALAEETHTSVKGTTPIKSRRNSVAASAPGQSTTSRLNALLKVWTLHCVPLSIDASSHVTY